MSRPRWPYFATLVQSDANFPLLEVAVGLRNEYPDLDIQRVLGRSISFSVARQAQGAVYCSAWQRLRAHSTSSFYRDLGFGGNVNHHYDP